MKDKKRNNKGFSLVELIVVILIMAVLAAAMAPQVMKWVENARLARDKHNYEEMVSVIQEALTQNGVYDEVKRLSEVKLTIKTGENTIEVTGGGTAPKFTNSMDKLLPGWKEVNPTHTTSSYWIKIKNGLIERDPNPDVSGIN